MSEMVEKVALALDRALYESDPNATHTPVGPVFDKDDEGKSIVGKWGCIFDGEVNLELLAKAAIEALKEPA